MDKVLIIFFAQADLEGEGEPLYVYQSACNWKTGGMTQAAPTCIFANGRYRSDEPMLRRLIADFVEADPARIQTPVLRTRRGPSRRDMVSQSRTSLIVA